jgi:sulfur transfer protein SufE
MPSEREAIRAAFDATPELRDRLRRMLQPQEGLPSSDEELTIAASPTHGGITGSKQLVCCECKSKVWIAPSTQEMMRQRGADAPTRIVCTPCLVASLKDSREKKGSN